MSAHAAPATAQTPLSRAGWWDCSLPLLVGAFVYLYAVTRGRALLQDGDTMWHIAAGQWILAHGAIPAQDPFSHTMPGAPWFAHEWLCEIALALAHDGGGWTAVVALASLAFAVTIGLLARALLRWLEPIHVLLVSVLAVLMSAGHLLARPHVLAMPLMMLWVIGLVRAREENRAPSLWLAPVMTVWANVHGGFTLGLALGAVLAAEAVVAARRDGQAAAALRSWGLFLVLGALAALLTPHGAHAFVFTWQVMVEDSFALTRIGEWRSPDFHKFQPFEAWLLALMGLAMYRGLRLPPVRLLLLLALVHLSLKHIRNVELLGLLGPLLVAPAFGRQWRDLGQAAPQFDRADRLMRTLTGPTGGGAMLLACVVLAASTLAVGRGAPPSPPEKVMPVAALRAAQQAGIRGPVLNDYSWGGYLIYAGVAPFIDGRADVYRDAFLKQYADALDLRQSDSLEQLLEKHRVTWTLLPPERAAIALLDHLPGWRRVYADATAVVHVKAPAPATTTPPAPAVCQPSRE